MDRLQLPKRLIYQLKLQITAKKKRIAALQRQLQAMERSLRQIEPIKHQKQGD